MTYETNNTHDENLKSWIESANQPDTDFPIQNLPFCVFARGCTYESVRVGVAIGGYVLDVYACYECCLFDDESFTVAVGTNNYCLDHSIMKKNKDLQIAFRRRLVEILSEDADEDTQKKLQRSLIPMDEVEFYMPAHIGDYTDFTARFFTPRMSARCSVPTIRCCRIINTFQSAITDAPLQSLSAARKSRARKDKTARTRKSRPNTSRARTSITKWN